MKPKCSQRWMSTVFSILILGLAVTASGEEPGSKDRMAVVNGKVITHGEYFRELTRIQRHLASIGKTVEKERMQEVMKDVLESMIDQELLYQESLKRGIKIEEKAVDEQLNKVKERFKDEAGFMSALIKMNHTEESLREKIGKGLAIRKLVGEEFIKDTSVTEEEAKAFYKQNPETFKRPEQVKAQHILIKVHPEAADEDKENARNRLEDIKKRIEKGEDFGKLAQEFSEGPTGSKGGDLGYFGRGQMVLPFEEAAFALAPGKVSDIVVTEYGYHLIKVNDHRAESKLGYDEIKDKLQGLVMQKKIQDRIEAYLAELKKQASIERYLTE